MNILEGIANTIGHYVAVDEDFHLTYDKRVAQVLVELDVMRGSPAKVEILCNDCLLVQRLDYLHVPFRCSNHRDMGHLRRSCPTQKQASYDTSLDASP